MARCRNKGCEQTIKVAGELQPCFSSSFGTCVPYRTGMDPDVPFRHHSVAFEKRADRLLSDLSSLPDPGMIATPSMAKKVVSAIRSARHDMLAEYAEEAVAALTQELEAR